MSIRLNKLLAGRGIGARRKCDTIIAEGRVKVNGRVVGEPGTLVEEQRDRIEVDGRPLPKAQPFAYFVINKPVGVITTLDDPQGRRTIAEFLPRGQRLYPVGRLDADTSGLLLLTNDGELAHRLMHPRYGVEKFYRVRLDREPGARQLERLAAGVEFEPGVVSAPARVRRIDPGFDAIMIEVAIHEGRFRQVRRMCEAVGLTVTGLHRVGYGPIRLGPLARGMWRELSEAEVERLRAASARPLRRPGAGERPARPVRPARPAPPAARRASRPPEGDEIEDTWIPGGGFAPDAADDEGGAEWPARAGRGRGDQGFRGEPAAKPTRGAMPWHAPEYRRGPKAASRPQDERRGPPDRVRARRDEPGRGGRDLPPRGGRAERAELPARPARAERPARFDRGERPGRFERGERPARFERGERTGPAERGGRPTRAERPARPARFDRGERPARFERGTRSEARRPDRGGRESSRGPRGDAPRPGRPGRQGGGRRDEARAPRGMEPRGRGPAREPRSGPGRGGSRRAFSPRPGREGGPGRSGGRPGGPSAGRRGGPGGPSRRPRNR